MITMLEEKCIGGEQSGRSTASFQHPETVLEMVGSQIQDGIVELPRHPQWPPVRSGGERRIDGCRWGGVGRRDRHFDSLRCAVQSDVDEAVTESLRLGDPI